MFYAFLNVCQSPIVGGFCPFIEEHPQDFVEGVRVPGYEAYDCVDGDVCRLGKGIGIDAGGNGGEGDRADAALHSEGQGALIAACQKRRFPVTAAAPDRAHGVDDVRAGEPVCPCDLCFPGGAAVQGASFRKKLPACRPVDRPIDAPAAQKGIVRGIHDGRHGVHLRDVAQNRPNLR